MVKPLRFTRSARKHRIGRASAYHVLCTAPYFDGVDPLTGNDTVTFIGEDERGRELTIVIVDKPDCYLVIHVQPTYRRRK